MSCNSCTLAAIPGVESLSITTNGVLLPEFAQDLFQAGIKRLNISLDTLNPAKYRTITRQDLFPTVWHGIQQALRVGFHPIKLNTVVLKGINDDEVEALARLTYEFPFHVRFIEVMPFAAVTSEHYLSGDEILARLNRVGRLVPTLSSHNNGPARYFRFPTALGKIGIINPLSHHSCNTCNRLRLTADGQLRTCLFAATEVSMKRLLREGASDAEVRQTLRRAIQEKPKSWAGDMGVLRKCLNRPMRAIGLGVLLGLSRGAGLGRSAIFVPRSVRPPPPRGGKKATRSFSDNLASHPTLTPFTIMSLTSSSGMVRKASHFPHRGPRREWAGMCPVAQDHSVGDIDVKWRIEIL